jgi:hypothetical protein
MFKMRCFLIALILAAAFLSACSTTGFGWQAEEADRKKPQFNEDFDPLSLDDDDIIIEPVQHFESDTLLNDRRIIDRVRTPEEEDAAEMVMGFRVQIMAAANEAQIQEEKRKAMLRFNVRVYVDFEEPNYKIRIGDCLTRREADDLVAEARRRGYEGSFPVRTMVYSR